MREISFVKRLKFNFKGSISRKALVIGDADNDQQNELVCANLQGDIAIFKDKDPNRYAFANDLGMVTACVVGDVINAGKNYVAAINTEGWLFIFDIPNYSSNPQDTTSPVPREGQPTPTNTDEYIFDAHDEVKSDGVQLKSNHSTGIHLKPSYDQRMPANCKELLLADLDGDGQNEVIVGLTDRVLRTYKWIKIGQNRGKFVGLYKWEFADQIGAVSLNPSKHENCKDIIVAQPGGTYAKLECAEKKLTSPSNSAINSPVERESTVESPQQNSMKLDGDSTSDDNVRTEFISKLTPEYHQLALAQMRNHHISTEVLGGIRDGKNSDSYSLIVIATLDGTLMLVNKDEILWSLQVDHQLFALAILESKSSTGSCPMLSQSESTCTIVPNPEHNIKTTGNNLASEQQSSSSSYGCYEQHSFSHQDSLKDSQYFVVCAWNGKTYIIDEERNYLRFKFDEAVSAFTAGNYHFNNKAHASLVYATFNNQIVLYYDVIIDHIRPMYLINEVLTNSDYSELLEKLETLAKKLKISRAPSLSSCSDSNDEGKSLDGSSLHSEQSRQLIRCMLQDVLYGVIDEELNV